MRRKKKNPPKSIESRKVEQRQWFGDIAVAKWRWVQSQPNMRPGKGATAEKSTSGLVFLRVDLIIAVILLFRLRRQVLAIALNGLHRLLAS